MITPISPGTNRAGKTFFVGNMLSGIVMSTVQRRPPTPKVTKLRVYRHAVSIAGQVKHGRCAKPTSGDSAAKPCQRPFKARVGYSLNVAATVTITIERLSSGRREGGECVMATSANLSDKHSTRQTSVSGEITQTVPRRGHGDRPAPPGLPGEPGSRHNSRHESSESSSRKQPRLDARV